MKKNKLLLAGVLVTLMLSACSEWLNLEPEDGVIRQEF